MESPVLLKSSGSWDGDLIPLSGWGERCKGFLLSSQFLNPSVKLIMMFSGSNRYLALKALRREYSTLDNPEMSILRKLGKLEVAFFHTHASTQDQFLCLGLKPLGCALRERFNSGIRAPGLPSLTLLVKTLLGKVVDFHQRGICHGGR